MFCTGATAQKARDEWCAYKALLLYLVFHYLFSAKYTKGKVFGLLPKQKPKKLDNDLL